MDSLKLPAGEKRLVGQFTDEFKTLYGNGLVSVILYGSATSGEFAAKHSNLNIAVILSDSSIENVGRSSRIVSKWAFRHISPVFFSEDDIRWSSDVFPIEFSDIKDSHALLFGKDVFRDLKIDNVNLRCQCEHELKSKLFRMKSLYAAHKGRAEMRVILFRSATSALHLLRNALRIMGISSSHGAETALDDTCRIFAINRESLSMILDAKAGRIKLSPDQTDDLFRELVSSMERAAKMIDAW